MYRSPYDSEAHVRIQFRTDPVRTYMAPQWRSIYPHFHYLYELLYVKRGEASFIVSDQVVPLRAGSLLLISNLENHAIQSGSPDFQRYSVCLSHEFLTAYLKLPALLSIFTQRREGFRRTFAFDGEDRRQAEALLEAMVAEAGARGANWDVAVALRLGQLLVLLSRSSPDGFPAADAVERNSRVFEIQTYIARHLAEPLTLEGIAGRFYVNKFHLSRIFKEASGYTLKQYIILERISKAKELLIHTDDRVADLSAAVGFANVSHFIRTFRELEGVPPAQYRKVCRQAVRPAAGGGAGR